MEKYVFCKDYINNIKSYIYIVLQLKTGCFWTKKVKKNGKKNSGNMKNH
jgi:hypothetical protein